MTERWTLIHGDCTQRLTELPADSVDSVVTDPPYELGFMGKQWDATGVSNNPETWAEVLRVLKPGGHLLAFGGTRTYHRMVCAIEDAGFEIRDSVHWIYGTGLPKSLNVAKAINKADGHATNSTQWEGWGTTTKPGHEPITLARKPLEGTVARNVLTYGTGALNIDGCRVATGQSEIANTTHGRWPTNLVFTHNHDCVTTENNTATGTGTQPHCSPNCPVADLDTQGGILKSGKGAVLSGSGRDGPKQRRVFGAESRPPGTECVTYGDTGTASRYFPTSRWDPQIDIQFRYTAKPSHSERHLAGVENAHPTVKPVALMRWLVRLVTPPGGVVLDPFAGSGTTMIAALIEGFDTIGVELTDEYIQLINARCEWAANESRFGPIKGPVNTKRVEPPGSLSLFPT